MRIIAVVLCLFCFVSCSCIGGEEEMTPSSPVKEIDAETLNWFPEWRDTADCGPNALLCLDEPRRTYGQTRRREKTCSA
jgi:hypothetical protein